MTRNEKTRLVLFILAVGLAIFFFTRGVYGITNKTEGVYEISAKVNDEVGTYAQGIKLSYYLSGTSNEIKSRKMEIEECYSDALLKAYKLTDPYNEYEGITNLCTLNNNIGKEIEVSDELYLMLFDALCYTWDENGYSVYAGSYYAHWNSILYLEDPLEFDPLFNEDEKERLEALRLKTLEEGMFSLEFGENNKVVLNVADEFTEFLEKNEEVLVYLDFNLLREAYMIKYADDMLSNRGYTEGLITTDKGLLLDLGSYSRGGYKMFTVEEGKLNEYDTMKVPANGSMSGICVVPFEENAPGFYSFEKDGTTYYRTPFATMVKDGFSNYVESSYVTSSLGDIVDAMYTNIRVYTQKYWQSFDEIMEEDSDKQIYVIDTQQRY